MGAEYITPLVFTVVLGTVLLNATTARPVAHWLGVFLSKSEGILIFGSFQGQPSGGRLPETKRPACGVD